MYIAAMLEKAGYKTEILDAFMSNGKFLKNGETISVGMPFEQIKQEIHSRKPDIVGVAGPFTCQIENSVKITRLIKQVDPSILTVVGGPHVTTVPKQFLEEIKSVDFAVTGEGEYTMLELAQYLEGKKQPQLQKQGNINDYKQGLPLQLLLLRGPPAHGQTIQSTLRRLRS